MVVVEAPFIEELSGMAIVKSLDMKEQATSMIKLKFIRNKAVLKITNKTHKTVTFGQTEMIGVVDLRSLGFYKIKQEVLQEHLGKHYHFKLADDICNQYNRFVNLMKKEQENSEGIYPWLEDTVHRMQNFTTWNEKTFTGKLHDWMEIYSQDKGVGNYAINSVLFLTTVREKYVKMYERFIEELKLYSKAIMLCSIYFRKHGKIPEF